MKPDALLPVFDVTPFTMLDYPDKTSCIVWLAGCNMRCPYCHNPCIVKGKAGRFGEGHVMAFLEKRKGLLDAVVLSGGEATLWPGVLPFARRVREMGFSFKLDTNGTKPAVVRKMLEENLLDFVALDYKAPPAKFKSLTCCAEQVAFDETLDLLIAAQDRTPLEIRTTVHTSLLDEKDVWFIMADLEKRGFRGKYWVQNYTTAPGGTVGDLPEQTRLLDIASLPKTEKFFTGFRNFPQK